jgi:cysteate synthase
MAKAWQAGRREISADSDMPDAPNSIAKVYADVLTNRAPPYGIAGGVYDALTATNGIMESVTTEESRVAERVFLEREGIDPDPAAAVCVAGLMKAVKSGRVAPDEKIFLNITGGGSNRLCREQNCVSNHPSIMADRRFNQDTVLVQVSEWVRKYV